MVDLVAKLTILLPELLVQGQLLEVQLLFAMGLLR